jgi:peroxiredoxin
MAPIAPGTPAPPIDGLDLGAAPAALFFFKVTCPVCRMAAPKVASLAEGYPGRVVGIGQDPAPKLAAFADEHGMGFGSASDPPPYAASRAYGIETVPTLFVIDAQGAIAETVESWDRAGYNRASRTLGDLAGLPYHEVSNERDGLPAFRPG